MSNTAKTKATPVPVKEEDKHTKGKLYAQFQEKNYTPQYVIFSDKYPGDVLMRVYEPDNEKAGNVDANAARIVECWNGWDNLQDSLLCTQNALNLKKEENTLLVNILEEIVNRWEETEWGYNPEIKERAKKLLSNYIKE